MWLHAQNKHGILNESSTYFQSASAALQKKQPTVANLFSNQVKLNKDSVQYQNITLSLCKHIVRDVVPIYKVESTSFKDLVNALNPR